MSPSNFLCGLGLVLALTSPATAGVAPPAADPRLACRIPACLPRPDSLGQPPECERILMQLDQWLGSGGAFPVCPQLPLKASPVGYEPYTPCTPGRMEYRPGGLAVCIDSSMSPPQQITARARLQPYYVDLAFPDAWRVRFWFARQEP